MNSDLEIKLRDILKANAGGVMMEIGCAGPDHPRHAFIVEHGIHYIGLDRAINVNAQPARPNYTYHANHDRGDYNWTLLKIIRERLDQKLPLAFLDVVFLDGHHTFTIDGMAFYLTDLLLKVGGAYVFDDYDWTLAEFESYLKANPYYESAYDFSRYDDDEMKTPPVREICDVLLPLTGCYELVEPGFAYRKINDRNSTATYDAAQRWLEAPTMMGEFRRRYVRERWRNIGRDGEPIAIFGAGRHTRWLLQAVWGVDGPAVACVLDDNPPAPEICGHAVTAPTPNAPPARRILLSSDAHEEALADRCRSLFGDAVEILRLYDGLPAGPYLR